MNILGIIVGQIDKILVWHLLGPTMLAIYSFATIPIVQIQSFFKILPILAFPKIAKENNKDSLKSLPKKLIKLSLIISIIVVLYILLAPIFFKIFFPEYIDSVIYSQIFSLTLIFFPARLLGSTLKIKKQKKSLYKIKMISPIIRFIIYIIALPLYGLIGLVISMILSLSIETLMNYYYFNKLKK